jgi:hypothetical protein
MECRLLAVRPEGANHASTASVNVKSRAPVKGLCRRRVRRMGRIGEEC